MEKEAEGGAAVPVNGESKEDGRLRNNRRKI